MAKKDSGLGAKEAAAIGAGLGAIAGAAAVALSNKETRKKLAKKFQEYKLKGEKLLAEAQKELGKLKK